MKPLDVNQTVDHNITWEKASLRVFSPFREEDAGPPLGELIVHGSPRKIVARARNTTIERFDGMCKVTMPPNWVLPTSDLRFPFLMALESRNGPHAGRVTYCACYGRVKNRHGDPENAVVAFESFSPVFLIPKDVDVEEVLRYETLLSGNPTDIMVLIQYQGYLWEHCKTWGRKTCVERALKKLATLRS